MGNVLKMMGILKEPLNVTKERSPLCKKRKEKTINLHERTYTFNLSML